jgi:hypothetical protein
MTRRFRTNRHHTDRERIGWASVVRAVPPPIVQRAGADDPGLAI